MKHIALYAILLCFWPGCRSENQTEPKSEEQKSSTVYVAGLRRSVYGLRTKNADHLWWAEKAKEFSEGIRGKEVFLPVIIEIVSVYLDDGAWATQDFFCKFFRVP